MPPEATPGTVEAIERTPEGTIKDQSPLPETKVEPKPEGEVKPEVKAEPAKEGEKKPTLINEKDGEKKDEPKGAPEKYEAFKLPEGLQLTEASLTEAQALFKESGLSQTQAQKYVDFHVAKLKEMAEAPAKLWQDTQKEWIDKAKADSEIGGKLPQVKADVSKALDAALGVELGKEFREAMDYTGAGNNPAFIKAIWKLSQRWLEGTAVNAGGPSKFGQARPGEGPKTAAQAIYPNLR